MNDWLTLTAMARSLQIPEPTARRYARLFAEYIPHRKVGHMTMYAPEASSVLAKISQLYAEGHKKTEVESILSKDLPQPIDIPLEDDGHSLVVKDNTVLQEKLLQFLDIVSDQSKKIDALMERDNQTSATIAHLKEELDQEKAGRKALEQTSAQYKQALCALYRGYKDHHDLIRALREQPGGETSSSDIDHLSNRLNHLEDMFLDDMGKLQQLMNQVLQSQ
ncbi:MAG: hypothetical protein CSA21_06455 [Deltaproteobacteria bacterium]|nr:MAG: hypothetical protein CSA21_06455 [Deltaproteobacteria bacterium]